MPKKRKDGGAGGRKGGALAQGKAAMSGMSPKVMAKMKAMAKAKGKLKRAKNGDAQRKRAAAEVETLNDAALTAATTPRTQESAGRASNQSTPVNDAPQRQTLPLKKGKQHRLQTRQGPGSDEDSSDSDGSIDREALGDARNEDSQSDESRSEVESANDIDEADSDLDEGSDDDQDEDNQDEDEADSTFRDLGLAEVLCEACDGVGYVNPTSIQRQAIPPALDGKDIVGIAKTGSGKTAAFILPVLNSLLEASGRKSFYCLVMAPTRELATQIQKEFRSLGAPIGLKTALLVGGMSVEQQQQVLSKSPHVIIATPGRIIHHLEKTKGFKLKNLKFLVLDEADRMLTPEFQLEMERILTVIPKDRTSFLFSATTDSRVDNLRRSTLRNPVHITIKEKVRTVDTLRQSCVFVPLKFKETFLVWSLKSGSIDSRGSMIIFCETKTTTMRLTLMLRDLKFAATCLHGDMTQEKRTGALSRFKMKKDTILVCTNVGARGLDIPDVELVLNFDLPKASDVYVHRVGRTARAGKAGRAISYITQYDIAYFNAIEEAIGMKLPVETFDKACKAMHDVVQESIRSATVLMKETDAGKRRGGKGGGNFNKKKKRH